uniref:NADH-ubiquinone oxidoreductase chain 3 n=1 Tax=Coleolaelaps cf. liui XFX-2019 TaxID=2695870 RepID=A0A6B9WEM9_9ACAR|nr:NADH dehydrogenase subunit 3 [Coleolaelaps cf. liui XFX-2019]
MILFMTLWLLNLMIAFIATTINLKLKWNFNKASMFECGFDSFFTPRSPFSLQFFKICIIFIFFDIEIIIILPSPLIFNLSMYFFCLFSVCLFIIYSSLIFEWSQGSLDWLK